jgi:hypothetical protein
MMAKARDLETDPFGFTEEEHARWDRNLDELERKWSPFLPSTTARKAIARERQAGARKKGVDAPKISDWDGCVDFDPNERDPKS